jgi:hypothetical protein
MIYDADNAGSFLPSLIPSEDQDRILIFSTSEGQPDLFLSEGGISFSGIFWNNVSKGMTIREAFGNVQEALGLFSGGYQDSIPLLDTDGNGIPNESSDIRVLGNYAIGAGIKLADEDSSDESASYEARCFLYYTSQR